ncbi:hypothetical protein TNCT_597651 [Trichonephila clavata]|uniref:Uncharacterized protein n=1 Tax=Trichonephila clavata TaxID=2740835 RepID=A0A8X6HRW9_TRICU|nr:hypothetical protein TNCT_597651 [Trichonephila clavata]
MHDGCRDPFRCDSETKVRDRKSLIHSFGAISMKMVGNVDIGVRRNVSLALLIKSPHLPPLTAKGKVLGEHSLLPNIAVRRELRRYYAQDA